MSVDPIFWLLAAIGFVVLEAMTLNLVSIWFAVGSAAALLSCLVTGSFRVQAVVFVAVSTLCLLALKPLCARLRKPPTATNGDRALGREAVVLTPCLRRGHRPCPAGRRGLERPLRHPRRHPDPRARAAGWPRSTAPCSSWSLS